MMATLVPADAQAVSTTISPPMTTALEGKSMSLSAVPEV
jgi:hypothetical protein